MNECLHACIYVCLYLLYPQKEGGCFFQKVKRANIASKKLNIDTYGVRTIYACKEWNFTQGSAKIVMEAGNISKVVGIYVRIRFLFFLPSGWRELERSQQFLLFYRSFTLQTYHQIFIKLTEARNRFDLGQQFRSGLFLSISHFSLSNLCGGGGTLAKPKITITNIRI